MPAPPNTSADWYLDNDTTVDTGTGIDIRNLDNTSPGVPNTSQTVTATHTNDSVERTWDPATGGVSTVHDARDLQKLGYAIVLADFTPSDSRCSALLPAGNATVTVEMNASWTGTPVGGPVTGLIARASLWKYDPATDTGTLIAHGSSAGTNWTTLESGTFKEIALTITWGSDIVFAAGETLLLQVGMNTGTLSNPVTGTVTYTFALNVGSTAVTRMHINTTTLRNRCVESGSCVGVGTATESARVRASKSLVGVGVSSRSALVVKAAREVQGVGVPTRAVRVAGSRDVVGVGVPTESARVRVSRDAVGVGTPTRVLARVLSSRDVQGVGTSSFSRAWVAARTGDAVGVGVLSFGRTIIFVREASAVGVGLASARVGLDIEDLPSEIGTTVIVRPIILLTDD